MAFVVIVVDVSDSIAQLNADLQRSGKPHEAVANLKNLMQACLGRTKDSTIQVTVRSTDPSVGTAGSGSSQESYDLA